MSTSPIVRRGDMEERSDEDVVSDVLAGNIAAFEIVMRRYNQRLYRVAISIVRDDSEAEDVMQHAYVSAFEHLTQFAGRARFSTWLTRITVHEALARARRAKRLDSIDDYVGSSREPRMPEKAFNPENLSAAGEMRGLIEEALLALPDDYRTNHAPRH